MMRSRTNKLFVGYLEDGTPLFLTPEERSTHTMIVGSPGSGKTTLAELFFRQDVLYERGCAGIDVQGPFVDRSLQYHFFLEKKRGVSRDVTLFEPSRGEWVTPFNPFVRGEGDISTQVDRRISATFKAWGQNFGNDTPRLEKWLRCLYTTLIERGYTILEAAYLIDTDPKVRALLTDALENELVKSKLDQLADYRSHEFLMQVESTENRLMRFSSQDAVGRSMGVGTNAINCTELMDGSGVLLVNLATGGYLSEPQQRLFGTMLIAEFYEAAMRRPAGRPAFHLYVDESGLFVTPELGRTLDYARQKGLHLTFIFQHLTQFKGEDPIVYKSVKNSALTKIVFRVVDREDALELADDIFFNLATPEVKYEHEELKYRLEDEWVDVKTASRSRSRMAGGSAMTGKSSGKGTSRNRNRGQVDTETETKTKSKGESNRDSFEGETASKGKAHADVASDGQGDFETEAESSQAGVQWATTETESETTTKQFITRHREYFETRPEFFTLEERRWRAAELLMTLPTGWCYVKRPGHSAVLVRVPKPTPVVLKPERLVELKEALHLRHSIPRREAELIIAERRARLELEAAKFNRAQRRVRQAQPEEPFELS